MVEVRAILVTSIVVGTPPGGQRRQAALAAKAVLEAVEVLEALASLAALAALAALPIPSSSWSMQRSSMPMEMVCYAR
ncbi:MAG: hypothetical protein R3C56_08175 [Pirellulaceae bacterium]